MKRHHTGYSPSLLPDPYESDWVPKNRGLVMHQQHCSLGGTFNQSSTGITPGNYMTWLTGVTAGNNNEGFWPSFSIDDPNRKYVIDAFDKFGTIETDEIAWFDRNLTYAIGQNGNGWTSAYLTRNTLKNSRFFDRDDVPDINDFYHLYGGYYPWGDVGNRAVYYPTTLDASSGYPGNIGFKVYDISDGNVQPQFDTVDTSNRSIYNIINWGDMNNVTGGTTTYGTLKTGVWQVPETDVILQLLGQLPRHNELAGEADGRWKDILDFFLIDKASDTIQKIPSPVGESWYHKNISGLGFVPNGKWQSNYVGQTEPNPDHFGVATCFATMQKGGGVAKTMIAMANSRNLTGLLGENVVPYNFTGIAVGSNWSTTGHNAGMRYCRIKTVEEKGYKLVVDGDTVLVVNPDDPRTDMPIGVERGIALRWMNREYRVVLKSYSDIQTEAAEILSSVSVEV